MKAHGKMRRYQGFTVIELMVGLTIGLVAVLMITGVFAMSNIKNRQIAGSNDAQQVASITNYQIGNILRQVGSNLADSNVWGCGLQAVKNPNTLLPGLGAWPTPFSAIALNLRLTPIAVSGADTDPSSRDSDIVVAMGGNGGTSNVFSATPGVNEFAVENSNGILPLDYLLMADTDSAAVGDDCYLFQVSSSFVLANTGGMLNDTPKVIPLNVGAIVSGSLALPATKGWALFNLGAVPKFYLLGVDSSRMTLTLYDLLQDRNAGTSGSAITLGENVFLLRVLYGIDDGTGGLTWHSPAESGWTFGDLQAGTQGAIDRLRTIKALRFALITRATYPSSDLSPDTIKLFSSLGTSLEQTVELTDAERRHRYQVYETVFPLFNI